jgi:hypothetical protein
MKCWQRLALVWLLASTVACSDESTGTANDGATNNGTGGDAGANRDPDGGSTGGTNGSDGGSSSAGVTGDELAVLAYCQTKFVRLASWESWAAVCCDQAGTVHDTFPIGGFGLEYLDACVLELQMPIKKGTLVFHRERAQACAMFQGRNFPTPYANCQTLPLDIFDAYFAAPSQTSEDCIAASRVRLPKAKSAARTSNALRASRVEMTAVSLRAVRKPSETEPAAPLRGARTACVALGSQVNRRVRTRWAKKVPRVLSSTTAGRAWSARRRATSASNPAPLAKYARRRTTAHRTCAAAWATLARGKPPRPMAGRARSTRRARARGAEKVSARRSAEKAPPRALR